MFILVDTCKNLYIRELLLNTFVQFLFYDKTKASEYIKY